MDDLKDPLRHDLYEHDVRVRRATCLYYVRAVKRPESLSGGAGTTGSWNGWSPRW